MRVWLNGIVSDMVRIRQGRVIGWVSTGTYGAHSFPRVEADEQSETDEERRTLHSSFAVG